MDEHEFWLVPLERTQLCLTMNTVFQKSSEKKVEFIFELNGRIKIASKKSSEKNGLRSESAEGVVWSETDFLCSIFRCNGNHTFFHQNGLRSESTFFFYISFHSVFSQKYDMREIFFNVSTFHLKCVPMCK